jgi:murein endopeptidase
MMPESPDGTYVFSTGTPERSRCGSQQLIAAIYTASSRWKQEFPDSTVVVGDLNEEEGHASHVNGVDVDITVIGTPDAANTAEDPTATGSIRLAELFADTGIINVIGYQDNRVISAYANYAATNNLPGVVQPWDGHADHFHVRIADEFRGPYSGSCGG